MFRSASPPAGGSVRLVTPGGEYGADVQADPGNTAVVWLATSKADAGQCLRGPSDDGTYPGVRMPPGVTVAVPGRDENNGLKELWLSSAAADQWVTSQSY